MAGLSGLLLALAYPSWGFDFGWLAWIGLVPLLWSLTRVASGHDRGQKRHGFWIGFMAGLVYFLIIFRWFWSIYPLDTFGIDSKLLSALVVGAIYIVSSAGMAAFWGLFGLAVSDQWSVISKSAPKTPQSLITNHWALITTPALFVLSEYLRSWGFGFLWAGSGSLFGPHWTMGNLAYALANNPLALKLASSAGIYGVSFLIVLVNCLFFIILKNKLTQQKLTRPTRTVLARTVLVGVIVVMLTLGPKLIKRSNTEWGNAKQINFAIIQTAQPTKVSPSPQEALAGFKEQLELLNRVAKEHPESQLILFPEASDFFKNLSLFLTSAQVKSYFTKLFKEPRLIISGGRVLDATTGKAYSRTFSLDTQGDIISFYDKRLLMPGGEFLPYPIKLLTYIFSKNRLSLFGEIRELNPGQKDVSTVSFRHQFNAAPLICSELVSPTLAAKTTQNADVIVSMASYGVFHGDRVIADQMLATTRFRAAENRKPIITAANTGRSYAIDAQGNIAFLSPGAEPQIYTGNVAIGSNKTWYNRWGETLILLGSLGLLIVIGVQWLVFSKKMESLV